MKPTSKLFIYITMVMFLSSYLYADNNILEKIKNIDSQMYQGTIKYYEYSFFNGDIVEYNMDVIYDEQGRYKTSVVSLDNDRKKRQNFYDGKDYVRSVTINKELIEVEARSFEFIDGFNFSRLDIGPIFRFGRGISRLDKINIDPVKNIATGYLKDGSRVIAYLDPKLDYAAYRLERLKANGDVFVSIENTTPIKVDNKYYIFSKSYDKVNSTIKAGGNLKVLSATFKKPKESDYLFDWIHSDLNIYDSRVGNTSIYYARKDLPNDITSEELLEITKKKATKEMEYMNRIKSEESQANNNNKYITYITFTISIIVILLLIYVVVKQIKNKDKI